MNYFKSILFLLVLVIIPLFVTSMKLINFEGFQSLSSILETNNAYPANENEVLLSGDYPTTGNKGISDNGSNDIWWKYPIFKVGSYAQITNNIKYPNNPDDGQCMPASLCGALYKDKPHMPSNYVKPLPPVPDCSGARINYYNTDETMLPYTNTGNINY